MWLYWGEGERDTVGPDMRLKFTYRAKDVNSKVVLHSVAPFTFGQSLSGL